MISDTIKKEDRGKAAAFGVLGVVFGDLMTFAVVYNLTSDMDPVYQFTACSATIFLLGLSFLYLVREPVKRDTGRFERMEMGVIPSLNAED